MNGNERFILPSNDENEKSTDQIEIAGASPANERVHENPRIRALMAAVQTAERNLNEALHDLQVREQSPTFQNAKELFATGWRMIVIEERQGEPYFRLYKEGNQAQVPMEYPFLDRGEGLIELDEEAAQALSETLGVSGNIAEIVQHLMNLTEEHS